MNPNNVDGVHVLWQQQAPAIEGWVYMLNLASGAAFAVMWARDITPVNGEPYPSEYVGTMDAFNMHTYHVHAYWVLAAVYVAMLPMCLAALFSVFRLCVDIGRQHGGGASAKYESLTVNGESSAINKGVGIAAHVIYDYVCPTLILWAVLGCMNVLSLWERALMLVCYLQFKVQKPRLSTLAQARDTDSKMDAITHVLIFAVFAAAYVTKLILQLHANGSSSFTWTAKVAAWGFFAMESSSFIDSIVNQPVLYFLLCSVLRLLVMQMLLFEADADSSTFRGYPGTLCP